jgi:SAM-dependent methyltransferase
VTFNRDLFDSVSAVYDERPPFFQTVGRELVRQAHLPGGCEVVDLGCGRGAVTVALHTEADVGHVTAVEADLVALPFPDVAFDHATSGFTLHILGASARAAAGEIYRVLRPGGTLTWSMPGPHPGTVAWSQEYAAIYAEFTAGLDDQPVEMNPTEPAERVLLEAEFELVEHEQVPVVLPVSGPEAYWDWTQTHGVRWLTDALDPDGGRELRQRVIGSLERLHPDGGNTIRAAPHVYRMRRV